MRLPPAFGYGTTTVVVPVMPVAADSVTPPPPTFGLRVAVLSRPRSFCGHRRRSRLHRGRPLQASGKPLIHMREARQVDPAHPGPGQHRGNVEVRGRESRAH
jgi:hypothetical protein